ncbi:uncharacterized protein QC761_121350 [Podospora bellae-mahoneyi]|uniref:Autophagy-related protein 1 n=1 Tax=Podospora bellae-mahoneyi TaxID=2093777 RepID=A0ABR0G1W5_9PEZI|nr:hypothetical protein QC761_121350 [Podospora bellae-mahoneyi]
MANHTSMSLEAVHDTRLPATVEANVTVHRVTTVRQGNPSWWQERWVRHDNNILGHGGCGLVWLEKKEKILEAEEDRWRAVKAIRVADSKSTNEGVRYVRELEALKRFSQPKYADFFVEFFGWYEIPNYLCIAMEYCEHGDLRRYLQTVKTMPEDEVKVVASQVLGALEMMHEAGYTHRDVKPANILIKSKPPQRWWVKVCDLGLSKRAEDIAGASTTVRGTPGFLAPEVLDCDPSTGQRDSFPIDMWCFGETVYQMLTGEPVFKTLAALFHYRAGSIEFPDQAFQRVNASPEARHFVRSLMLAHPPLRRTATAHPIYGAQGHPWMAIKTIKNLVIKSRSAVSYETATAWPPPLPQDGDQITGVSGKWTQTVEIAKHSMAHAIGSFGDQSESQLPSIYPALPGLGQLYHPSLQYAYSNSTFNPFYYFLSPSNYYVAQYLNAMINTMSGGGYKLPAVSLRRSVLPKRVKALFPRNVARSKPAEVVKREFKEAITKAASKVTDNRLQPKDTNLDAQESIKQHIEAADQHSDSNGNSQPLVGQSTYQQPGLSGETRFSVNKENKNFAEDFKPTIPVPSEMAELFSRGTPPKSNPAGTAGAEDHDSLRDETEESWTVVTSRRKHSGPAKRRPAPPSPSTHARALPARKSTPTPNSDVLTTQVLPVMARRPAPRLPQAIIGRQSWAEVVATEGGEPE